MNWTFIDRSSVTILAAVVLFAALSSCTHVSRPDGPPNFYVDESRIPNAVPKKEPLAKLGNKPYTVFGNRYHIMKSAARYEAVGVASWYGTKFHARKTSSGEPYNMLAMTAAHRSLPLPTYVEVTNLKNRRKIIVKVNDRGPFRKDRIIDLSYVAAKKLGMIGHGTALVKIRAITPPGLGSRIQSFIASRLMNTSGAARHSATHAHYASTKAVYLQVGAFKNKLNAEKLKQRLVTLLNAPVNVTTPGLTSTYYKVRIGPIEDMAVANTLTQRLNTLGFKPNRLGIE